jgi:hypoxanthine phosphoribosyltransferase
VGSALATELDALAALSTAKKVCSAEEIDRALARMAEEIDARFSGANPVVLAVMHGGVFAAVELCRRFSFPYEFDYVHATRYDGGLQGGELEWRMRPSGALAGRAVLVVDDVLDRGATLAAIAAELERIGVARQLTAALVVKRVAHGGHRPRVDVVGVEVDDVYVFGCGMDYRGYWRGLRALYALDAAHTPANG